MLKLLFDALKTTLGETVLHARNQSHNVSGYSHWLRR